MQLTAVHGTDSPYLVMTSKAISTYNVIIQAALLGRLFFTDHL
jgi:hypothetical protein